MNRLENCTFETLDETIKIDIKPGQALGSRQTCVSAGVPWHMPNDPKHEHLESSASVDAHDVTQDEAVQFLTREEFEQARKEVIEEYSEIFAALAEH
ncbi:hypothetical protein GCM10022631_11470 [Deinococcus rubellus]|uniref:hypothetical protein n=1 Tax=Deinococcus rubellus TaxID=1889240 RepID=UPI0031F11674